MRLYILAVIAVILTNDSCADERTNQNNLITKYDPGETHSKDPSYEQATAENTSDRSNKLDNDPIKRIDTESAKSNRDTVLNLSFDDDDYDQSNHILPKSKIKFEGNNDDPESSTDYITNDVDYNDFQSDTSQVVFKDENKSNNENYEYFRTNERPNSTPIKFENQNDEPNRHSKQSDRKGKFGRITFEDDKNKYQEPVQKKKRKPKKAHFQTLLENDTPIYPNSPYTGIGYAGYAGTGLPRPDDLGAGATTNKVYPSYPTANYAHSGDPSQYAASGNSGYPLYPGSPPISQGYGLYPSFASGNQDLGNPRPLENNVAYPSTGQGALSGHSKYPNPLITSTYVNQGVTASPGLQHQYYQGYPLSGYGQPYPGAPSSQYPGQGQIPYRPGPYQPGLLGGGYRPTRRPKSLTERAVSAVAEALTSIALYDDYMCVPRLLCEVAGGSAASSPSLLKATAGLQPLLTLLQSYNGVSTSPLFVFGRAAVTGMTSKGNPSICRQSYPQCPNEPEQLINYLNNHNGGFFRFFGQPQVPQQPQNLEQFYNYLSGQYGFQQQPQYTLGYPSQYNYGLLTQNPYANPPNYGANYYRDQNSFKKAKNIDDKIEARIQNKPGVNGLEDEDDIDAITDLDNGSKWLFPGEVSTRQENDIVQDGKTPGRPNRGSRTLKFPDDGQTSDDRPNIDNLKNRVKKQKSIFFPGGSNTQFRPNYQTASSVNSDDYVFDHEHNFYVKRPKFVSKDNDDLIYIVRGNGDPYHPEIIKINTLKSKIR